MPSVVARHPRLLMPSRFDLPPDECYRGTTAELGSNLLATIEAHRSVTFEAAMPLQGAMRELQTGKADARSTDHPQLLSR